MKAGFEPQKGDLVTRLAEEFHAERIGAPFKVILYKSVEVTYNQKTGQAVGYTIPDLDGLLRMIAWTRVLHPWKLTGKDIKFLRKAMGVKAKDLAKKIEVTPEHLSKCENGTYPISPASEKLLRMFLFKMAWGYFKLKPEEARKKLEDALDKLFDTIKPIPAHDAEDELVLVFSFSRGRASRSAGKGREPVWNEEQKKKAA